jgi:hypothetical protein
MSRELDDVASAFAALQAAMADVESPGVQAAMNEAIDALLMAIGAFNLRLAILERSGTTGLKHDRHVVL